jgi:cytochrome c-type biogenesis protein CcmH/NrfG
MGVSTRSFDAVQIIVEEEFEQSNRLSASARARRVLSRFLVVVIVSLAIESLVAWGVFIRLSQQGQARED